MARSILEPDAPQYLVDLTGDHISRQAIRDKLTEHYHDIREYGADNLSLPNWLL